MLQRLRHRRGFGVHSPFAFEFITSALREPKGCAYYAYAGISRRYRQLYRVAVRACPQLVTHVATDDDLLAAVRQLGQIAAGAPAGSASLIQLSPYSPADTQLWQQTLAAADSGMSFTTPSLRVFIANPSLPRQDFLL